MWGCFVIGMTTGRVLQPKVICGGFVRFEAPHQTILGTKAIHDSAIIINRKRDSELQAGFKSSKSDFF